MRGILLFLLLSAAAVVRAENLTTAEEFQPNHYEVDRYRHLWEKSPFVVEKPALEPSAPGLGQRFVLTAIAGVRESPVIFVLDRSSLSRSMVTKKKNSEGIELVSVEASNDPRTSWAVIRSGDEQGTIKYDPGALQNVNQADANKPLENKPVEKKNDILNASSGEAHPNPEGSSSQLKLDVKNAPPTNRKVRRLPIDLTKSQ